MKKQEIVSVLYELYKITGFRMSLHDANYNEIAAYPEDTMPICKRVHSFLGEEEKCKECDRRAFKTVLETKEPIIYKCRYGLTEAISPLYNFGIHTGFLMMGQIMDERCDRKITVSELTKLGVPKDEAEELVKNMRTVCSDMISSYVRIMTICAQYLTLSNAVPGTKPTIAESANKFIHENIDKRLTISDICTEVGCSKTTLISAFKKEFGITVNDAITKAKLDEAKHLLSIGKHSICEVARMTGFYDQSYFSKVFSKEYGITPTEFKKEISR